MLSGLGRVWFVLLVGIGLSMGAAHAAGDTPATVMHFEIKSSGQAAYTERVLVSPRYVRFDGGGMDGVYILFDRSSGTIYSVSPGDKDVLTIKRRAVTVKPSPPLKLSVKSEAYKGAPLIEGHTPQHVAFFANGERCYDEVVVPGLLNDARRAFAAFRTTLAGQQAMDYGRSLAPPESACEQARLIFAPTRYLDHGFPIQGWSPHGDARRLLDFKTDEPVPTALFQLPLDYRYYTTGPQGMHDIPAPGS